MAFRRIKGDVIYTADAWIHDHVLITDEEGTVEAILHENEVNDPVEKYSGIISPGLVNSHCHLELSHMRGKLPEHTGLADFVYRVVSERAADDEVIASAIAEAEQEMVANGIVAVGDICNNAHTLQQKQYGNICYYNFIEASGWLPSLAESRYERALQLYDVFSAGSPLHPSIYGKNNCSVVPHAPYSVSANLWKQMQEPFSGKVVSIHNQETRDEDEFFKTGGGGFNQMYRLMNIDNTHHVASGTTSLQSYFGKLQHAASVLLVHNTFTSDEDLDFLAATGQAARVHFCICINANLYIENALPPVDLFRKYGFNIVLGTDSLASNHHLSILNEMQTLKKHFQISSHELIRWATTNGAAALGLQSCYGGFLKGSRPGVLAFDENFTSLEKIF